jgi:phosphopantetheine--protein transferase-like protein
MKIKVGCYNLDSATPGIKGSNHPGVIVYLFRQKDFYPCLDNFYKVLSSDEQTKAQRLVFPSDRQNYYVCHALLRHLLSKRAGVDPKDVKILAGQKGKPFIEDKNIAFNISHTRDLCAIAISGGTEVGIDIEKIRVNNNFKDIADSYFSEREQEYLKKSANPLEDFYLLWTRKEALLKAIGIGLNTPLKKIGVCGKINQLAYENLCGQNKFNVDSQYYIYSGKGYGHLISIATPFNVGIETKSLTIDLLKTIAA